MRFQLNGRSHRIGGTLLLLALSVVHPPIALAAPATPGGPLGTLDTRPARGGDPRQEVHYFEQQAQAGVARAAMELGVRFFRHDEAPQNNALAMHWFRQALALGDTEALIPLGDLLRGAPGIVPQPEEAAKLYQRAAHAGDQSAWEKLGDLYAGAPAPLRNGAKAITCYRQAKTASALVSVGRLLEAGRLVARDEAGARKAYEEALQLGENDDSDDDTDRVDPWPRERLAIMLELGLGGPVDVPQALETYRYLGIPTAAFRRARILETGRGVPPNPQVAVQSYAAGATTLRGQTLAPWRELAEQLARLDDAQNQVSRLPDAIKAPLVAAADKGNPQALYVRAWLGTQAIDVQANDPAIASWLKRAVKAGSLEALLGVNDQQSRWPLETLHAVADGYLTSQEHPRAIPGASLYQQALEAVAAYEALNAYSYTRLDWTGVDIGAVQTYAQALTLLHNTGLTPQRMMARNWPNGNHPMPKMPIEPVIANLFLQKADYADTGRETRRWLEVAARIGSPAAQADLALSFEDALQGPPDLAQAYTWYDLAASGGHPLGTLRCQALEQRLNTQAIARAQDRAVKIWLAQPWAKPSTR